MNNLLKLASAGILMAISTVAFCDHADIGVDFTLNNYTNTTTQAYYFDSAEHKYGKGLSHFTANPKTNITYPVAYIWSVNRNTISDPHIQGCVLTTANTNKPIAFSLHSIWRYKYSGGESSSSELGNEPSYYNSVITSDTGGCYSKVNNSSQTYGLLNNSLTKRANPSSTTMPATQTSSGVIMGMSKINSVNIQRGYTTFITLSYVDYNNGNLIHYTDSVYCVNTVGKGQACPWFTPNKTKTAPTASNIIL